MDIPFLQARYYMHPPEPRRIDLVVMHAAAFPPGIGAAAKLMEYCAHNDRVASWHYAVDRDAISQSVKEEDIAFHAPGANQHGIGIELATIYQPTDTLWSDSYHQKMLLLSAWLVAGICNRYKIDPFFVDAAGLLENRRGITVHAEVTKAYGKSSHMDPGPHFPLVDFLDKISTRLKTGNFEA